MPGIVPMKLLTSSAGQSRIAQACDRCRSKKIKCDGRLPSCSQCLGVGFECKTSDKLSRRAFPRGYTESLEEKVRTLEAEVRELKGLLDEKEEKIDMICKVRNGMAHIPKASSGAESRSGSVSNQSDGSFSEPDSFKILQSPILVHEGHRNAYSMGNSSSRSLLCAYKQKAQQSGDWRMPLDVNAFYPSPNSGDVRAVATQTTYDRPARMLTDRLVNVFFQEISPLWPILHRPTFLKIYDDFVTGDEVTSDPKILAQLFLVFGVAALATRDSVHQQDLDNFEAQWTVALEAFDAEESLINSQCLTLATLYFMKRAEYPSMLKYKGHAVTISQRLGLHRNQNGFTYDALTKESRKKVFWTLFTLDAFSAASLGLPALMDCGNVQCELPVDVDDLYITDKGFMPTLPNESTKLSSAIALFQLAKVLSKVLRDLYPAAASYDVPYSSIASLQDELDSWSTSLPAHLRLHFENDKPSTRIVSDRSPILSFAFHYVKSLVSKVVILSTSQTQDRCTSSTLSLASSAKKIIQISDLLQERGMIFAFCLDENEALLGAVFGLLLESVELGSATSTVHKENIKLAMTVSKRLNNQNCLGHEELDKVLTMWSTEERAKVAQKTRTLTSTQRNEHAEKQESLHRRGLKAIAKRFNKVQDQSCPQSQSQSHSQRQKHGGGNVAAYTPGYAGSEKTLNPPRQSSSPVLKRSQKNSTRNYESPAPYAACMSSSTRYSNEETSSEDWQDVLSNLDSGHNNIYDLVYGAGASVTSVDYSSISSLSPEESHSSNFRKESTTTPGNQQEQFWSAGDWNLSSNFTSTMGNVPTSVVSYSSEDTPSLEELGDLGYSQHLGDLSSIVIPSDGSPPLMATSSTVWMQGLDPLFNASA